MYQGVMNLLPTLPQRGILIRMDLLGDKKEKDTLMVKKPMLRI